MILQHVFKWFLYLLNIYFNLHIPTYIENLPCHAAVLHGPFGKPDYLKAILFHNQHEILTSMYFPPNLHLLILFPNGFCHQNDFVLYTYGLLNLFEFKNYQFNSLFQAEDEFENSN